jgi:hypothetical protein
MKTFKGAQGLTYSAPGFLHKSDPYGLVTEEQSQKILNCDGLGSKIANLYFLALSLTSLKYFKRCRPRHLKMLNAVGDSIKKI